MMFLLKAFVIAILCYLGQMLFPWWIIPIAAFIGGATIPSRGINSFLSGFLGAGLLWLIQAWRMDLNSASIISSQIAPIFQVEETALLIIATAFIGAATGGLGALTGHYFAKNLPDKDRDKYYGRRKL